MENENLKPIEKLTPFTKMIMTIGTLPSSFYSSMTYYEAMVWLYEYLKNDVIPAVNNNGEAVEELQGLYQTLHDYVENYFTNLDVQEEINKKLDEMAEDGTLTNLIKDYVDPIYEEYENSINNAIESQDNEISNFKTAVNSQITTINTKVNNAVSGSPLVASSTSGMTDTTRVYVNTTDGNWYYYDGDSWEIGGTYQATATDFDYTLTENDKTPNSNIIGDKINNNVETINLFNYNDILDNQYIGDDGNPVSSTSFFVTNLIYLKQGDILYTQYNLLSAPVLHAVRYDNYNNFAERLTASSKSYQIPTTGLYRFNIAKGIADNIDLTKLTMTINHLAPKITPYNQELINNKDIKFINTSLNNFTQELNVFNYDESIHTAIADTGTYESILNNYQATNIISCKTGDVFYLKNFGGTSAYVHRLKYDTDMHFVNRSSISGNTWTADYTGYVIFNISRPADQDISDGVIISKNIEVNKFYPYGKVQKDDVELLKENANKYLITFGDFNISLYKYLNQDVHANNWNISILKDNKGNTLISAGTDILGPVLINENEYLGGVHGYENTEYIKVSTSGTCNDLTDINYISGDTLTITIKSNLIDHVNLAKKFDRYITLIFSKNKIRVSNNFKASTNVAVNRACNGGIFGCNNDIVKDIILSTGYYASAPSDNTNINRSHYNTTATINTLYGSISCSNIKGHENENYRGYCYVYTDQNPVNLKVYFDILRPGQTYNLSEGDSICGEFEYMLS